MRADEGQDPGSPPDPLGSAAELLPRRKTLRKRPGALFWESFGAAPALEWPLGWKGRLMSPSPSPSPARRALPRLPGFNLLLSQASLEFQLGNLPPEGHSTPQPLWAPWMKLMCCSLEDFHLSWILGGFRLWKLLGDVSVVILSGFGVVTLLPDLNASLFSGGMDLGTR